MFDVQVCMFCFMCICEGTGFVDFLEKGFVYEEVFLYQSFIVLLGPCAVDGTLKSNY